MMRHKAYQFRIYPTKEQQVLIAKTIGCARFVFNHFLAEWDKAYKETGKGLSYGRCSAGLPALKKQAATEWLKEVDSIALQSAVRHLSDAYDRFFKQQNQAPRFKSKRNPVQSYTTKQTNGNIAVVGNRLKLPKLGLVKFAKSREVEGRILNATIRRNPSGNYFVAILCEVVIAPLPKTRVAVGVDLGLRDFAILSDGETRYENPKCFRQLEPKLAQAQKILSRRMMQAKKDGKKLCDAKNYQKQKRKVARIHEDITNKRKDYLHKITTEIIKNHDVIGIEDLQVASMVKNHRLAKAINEVSWRHFRTLLAYKADWYGKKVVVVAKDFPSSQLCSGCGYQHKDVKNLTVRGWVCPACGAQHDRDSNASINLKNEALRLLSLPTVGITGLA